MNVRARIAATTLTLAVAAVGMPGQASASTAGGSDLDRSIVRVLIHWEATVTVPFTDGTRKRLAGKTDSSCTGWFASTTGDIATAGHCVKWDEADRLSMIANLIVANHWQDSVKATEVEWSVTGPEARVRVGQAADIDGPFAHGSFMTAQIVAAQGFLDGDNALLRVADLADTPALALAAGTPEVGEQVTSIGFPGSVSDVSDVARQRPSHKNGTVSSRQYSEHGVANTEIDAAVSGGMSGGPTVDDTGAVIGINSFKITGEAQPFNFVTDVNTLRAFLAANGVALVGGAGAGTPTGTTPGSTTPGSTTAATTTGATTTADSAKAAPSSGEASRGHGNGMLYLLGGGAVLLVQAGLGGAFLALRRRRSPAVAVPQPVSELLPS